VVVRDAVREVLLVVRLVRVPALAGVRLVLRLVVPAGFRAPGVVVDISRTPSQLVWKMIEHVFVHDRLARVTAGQMKVS
jgi:hypothetical protein